jgi:hypothetical protein
MVMSERKVIRGTRVILEIKVIREILGSRPL